MFKRTLLALALYCLASLGAPYFVYKHLGMQNDTTAYLELIDRPWSEISVAAPHRYRILTPLLARSVWWLPYFSTDISAADRLGSIDQRAYWNLVVVNYAEALFGSALCFYLAHAVFRFAAPTAFIGGMFFLFSYPGLVNWTLADVGAQVFILLALVCYFRQRIWAFGAVCTFGAMQKEIVFVTVGSFLMLEAYRRRLAIWPWCAALVPAVLTYVAMTVAWPAPIAQLERGTIGWPSARSIFGMFRFSREYVLTMAPLVVAIGAHVYLRWRHGVRLACPLVWLWLVPILTAVSVITNSVGDMWGASGRHASFAFGVIMLYQLEVLEAVAARCGWINVLERRNAAVWAPWTQLASAVPQSATGETSAA